MPLVPVTPKLAIQSKTVWAGALQFVPALVAVILHFAGAIVLDPGALSSAVTLVVTGGLTILLRFLTGEPVALRPPPPPPDEPRRPSPTRRPTLYGILLIALPLMVACSQTHLQVRGEEVLFACDSALYGLEQTTSLEPEARELVHRGCMLGAMAALRVAGVPVVTVPVCQEPK